MKTALFTFTHLEGNDASSTPRLFRAHNFLQYYMQLQSRLGFEKVFISDNGSAMLNLAKAAMNITCPYTLIDNPLMARGPGLDYACCWRQQYDVKRAIDGGYDKIIVLDDDAYLLSDRIIKYVKNLNSGWTTFWCPKYQFPECAAHVLCRDAFPIFEAFTSVPFGDHIGKTMERTLPFTNVNKDFNCDRYGENYTAQLPEIDGYFQCPGNIILTAEKAK